MDREYNGEDVMVRLDGTWCSLSEVKEALGLKEEDDRAKDDRAKDDDFNTAPF